MPKCKCIAGYLSVDELIMLLRLLKKMKEIDSFAKNQIMLLYIFNTERAVIH